MKIGYWNSRGIGRRTFWQEIDTFCKLEQIQIMAIAETKTERPSLDKLWRKAGFDNMVWSPAQGKVGGIMLFWKDHQLCNAEISMVTREPIIIAIKYKNLTSHYTLVIWFVYGPP